eukprot:7622-Heterococcus_DN1.PRE.1
MGTGTPKLKRGSRGRIQRTTLPCYKWQDTGSCSRGDSCHFAHDEEVVVVDVKQTNHTPTTQSQATKKDT